MKFRNRLFVLPCLLLLSSFGLNASAELVSFINGLDIDGTLYDVTFHPGQSFNNLWDADGDGAFGNDTSTFNAQPTFWRNETGAVAARDALNHTTYPRSSLSCPTAHGLRLS